MSVVREGKEIFKLKVRPHSLQRYRRRLVLLQGSVVNFLPELRKS